MTQNKKRKGIMLIGGKGTRLNPLTSAVNKHLLPIYNKPMVYYPLSNLIQARVKDILLIGNPEDLPLYQNLLGDGSQWGLSISYKEQPEAGGIAQALLIGEEFLDGAPVMLILGDNIFYGLGLGDLLQRTNASSKTASVFAYHVSDPERYGVVAFDKNRQAIDIEEKPQNPKSNYAVTGIYFYDGTASERTKALTPSARGELEITDLNRAYMADNALSVSVMSAGIAWLDTGTFSSMLQASSYVEAIENRQGLLIGSPEYNALRQGFITHDQIDDLIAQMPDNEYTSALKTIIDQGYF